MNPKTEDVRRTGNCLTRGWWSHGLGVAMLTTLLIIPRTAQAQDEDLGWTNASELQFLISGGNGGASTLGFRNTLRWVGEASQVRFDVSSLRTDATTIERFAEGSPDDFAVREESETERTAERYSAEGRYDRDISERFFLFGGLGWKRDTFAGFESRVVAALGAGNQWGPGEDDWLAKLGYGVTYTTEEDVTPNPDVSNSFAGARVTLEYLNVLTESMTVDLRWVIDENLDNTDDLRGDFVQSVTTALGSRLSLKTTLQLLWDNDPPLDSAPLVGIDGEPTGEDVLVPFETLDHNLTIALVLTL